MGRPPRITRQELLDCARQVFAAKGFEGATLADIASQLRVTAAAVLRHVPSKHALFAEAMRSAPISPPDAVLELRAIDGATDPRVVLRRLAEQFVPFLQKTIAEHVVIYMHRQAHASIVFPFDLRDQKSPPRRVLAIMTRYFRRAAAAGAIRLRDPRASALLFLGSLQSYVFFHQVLNITPYPLAGYVDALIDLWTEGAVGGDRARKEQPSRSSRFIDGGRRGRGGRNVPLRAGGARAAGADRVRNGGGAHGQRRVSRRRPRHRRPDR